jgi:hypothetical protein
MDVLTGGDVDRLDRCSQGIRGVYLRIVGVFESARRNLAVSESSFPTGQEAVPELVGNEMVVSRLMPSGW